MEEKMRNTVSKAAFALAVLSSLTAFADADNRKYDLSPNPKPVLNLPFSPIRILGDTAYISGTLPIDPATGKLREGTIDELTQQIFENIQRVLASEGLSLNDIVKTTVLLTDIKDFAEMNRAYARILAGNEILPARSTIGVAALPLGSRIEIECIAQLRR